MKIVKIETEYIKLEQLMKLEGLVGSGSDAKYFIRRGDVLVNESVELQRGKKLRSGDIMEYNGERYKIE